MILFNLDMRKKFKNLKILQFFSSVKLTVGCLSLLFILVFWGTVAQVNEGLFLAQKRFFSSWFFLAGEFFPFPGAQLVLWILFVNLICAGLTQFKYLKSHIGIALIHLGLLTYFVSAFVTFHVTQESQLTLMEGAGSNVSSAYNEWELSIWPTDQTTERNVLAFDTTHLQPGDQLSLEKLGLNFFVKKYFTNAKAYTTASETETSEEHWLFNDSGVKSLNVAPFEKEAEKNFPGVIFEVTGLKDRPVTLLLYGAEEQPTKFKIQDTHYNFQLRRKRYPLPFTLTLKNFEMDTHPGTEIASRYQSLVQIKNQGLSREVLIYMNSPLRYKNYTFYQASYAIDALERELSTLSVVKNSGRLLPYISSAIVFIGLLVHFLGMALARKS